MDGLDSVQARIASIQAFIATVTSSPVRAGATASPVFSTALAQAMGAAATPTSTASGPSATGVLSAEDGLAASRLRSTGLTSSATTAEGVPLALAAHGNGQIPTGALSPIGAGTHRLWAPAAQAFTRLQEAAARDGVHLGVTDSYRTLDAQVDLAERKGLYSQGGLAAAPGTSDHGWGRALDLDLDEAAQAWMRTNAGRFGFTEDTPREPWHWTYAPPA